jgi:hypothetical protein
LNCKSSTALTAMRAISIFCFYMATCPKLRRLQQTFTSSYLLRSSPRTQVTRWFWPRSLGGCSQVFEDLNWAPDITVVRGCQFQTTSPLHRAFSSMASHGVSDLRQRMAPRWKSRCLNTLHTEVHTNTSTIL